MDISCIVFSRSSKIFPNFNIFEFFLFVVVVISLQTGSLVHFPGEKSIKINQLCTYLLLKSKLISKLTVDTNTDFQFFPYQYLNFEIPILLQ